MTSRDFIFNNKRLSDFGLVIALNKDDDVNGMSREILRSNPTVNRKIPIHYGAVYNEPISFSFFVVRYDCNGSENTITPLLLRKIQNWLTKDMLPKTLYVENKYGEKIEYNGIFSNITTYVFNGLNGLILTFTNDSPFSYITKNKLIKIEENILEKSFSLYCDSDDNDYIYPIITYIPTDSSIETILTIKNKTDNNQFMKLTISKLNYKKIIIDCYLKRIICDDEILTYEDVGLNFEEIMDYNNINSGILLMYWFRLLTNNNEIEITGSEGIITITYKISQKLGGITYV